MLGYTLSDALQSNHYKNATHRGVRGRPRGPSVYCFTSPLKYLPYSLHVPTPHVLDSTPEWQESAVIQSRTEMHGGTGTVEYHGTEVPWCVYPEPLHPHLKKGI